MAIQYYADQNIEGKLTVSTVLRVNDSGSSIKGVGINTMNPGGELQVVGAGSIGNIYVSANAAGSSVTDSLWIKKEALKASIINRDGGDLALGANNSEKVTIKGTGKVGIGTTSPTVELQVGNFGGTETPEIIVAGGTSSQIQLNTSNATGSFAQVGFGGSQYANSNTAGKIKYTHTTVVYPSGDIMSFRVNYSDRMVINGSGSVGIGTTSPSRTLHVVGTLRAGGLSNYVELDSNGNIRMSNSVAGILPTAHSTQTLSIGATMTGYWDTIVHHFGNEAVWIPGVFGSMDGMNLSNAGDLLIKGDVGIGTTGPLEKLQVNGNAAIYGEIKGYVGSSSNQYLSILQSSNLTYISTGTTNETIYFGIGPVANVTNINVAGTATATNFILSSDKTLKDKIKDIKTNHVDVKWKNFELISEPGVKRSGVIAQELEAKHPEFIRTDKDGLKSVAYIDLLITKIAELEARLEKAGL